MVVDKRLDNGLVYDPIEKKDLEKFPRSVFLIIFNEFCERFSYSGMRAFLALYLKQKLLYSDDEATEVYHIFTTMAYFCAIFGAIMADSFFGKFRTILYLMVVYAIGNIIITLAAIPTLALPGREITMLGLLMVGLGTGGIKPCVSSFGGDQFVLPEQEKQLTYFFSLLYIILCMAALVAKSISPLLRSEVHCFGDKDCFSLAFGAPGILIIISIVIFACGKRSYIIKKPSSNILMDIFQCISTSLKARKALKNQEKKYDHWLDYARGSYDQTFINDLKKTFRIFLLFTPLAVFWALLDQMGSRWTLQATRMDGEFPFFTIRPDQMQVMSPIIILFLVPLFRKVIYPVLGKFGFLRKSLSKLLGGCVLAGISFICSGCLELELQKTYPVLPSDGLGQLRIFNGYSCEMSFTNRFTGESFTVNPLDMYENKLIQVERSHNISYNRTLICPGHNRTSLQKIHLEEEKAISYFYGESTAAENHTVLRYEDCNDKSRSGLPFVRILGNIQNKTNLKIWLRNSDKGIIELWTNSTFTERTEVFAGNYELYVNTKLVPMTINLRIGGVYTLLINDENEFSAELITVTEPNSISMIWIIPQMFIICTGEVLFAITGLEYAFKEAPESMKAVLQAYWLFVEAVGNMIIIMVTRLGSGYTQVYHFFFFSCLMFVATVIFKLLARRHEKYKEGTACTVQHGDPANKEMLSEKYMEMMQIDDTLDR